MKVPRTTCRSCGINERATEPFDVNDTCWRCLKEAARGANMTHDYDPIQARPLVPVFRHGVRTFRPPHRRTT